MSGGMSGDVTLHRSAGRCRAWAAAVQLAWPVGGQVAHLPGLAPGSLGRLAVDQECLPRVERRLRSPPPVASQAMSVRGCPREGKCEEEGADKDGIRDGSPTDDVADGWLRWRVWVLHSLCRGIFV